MKRKLTPVLLACVVAVGLGGAYLLAQDGAAPGAPNAQAPGEMIAQVPPGGPGAGPGGPGGGAPPPGMMPGGPGMGQGMGPGMGVSQNPPFERMGGMIQFIGHMGDALFNPQIAGMIAVGGLKDEMRAKPEDKIKFFEAQLEKTKSLGLRNAIRMVLKDLYKAQSDDAKAMDQLKAMLEENAAAAQQMQSQTKPPAK